LKYNKETSANKDGDDNNKLITQCIIKEMNATGL